MRPAFRWFGATDPVRLDDIRQTGATDVVTALHDVPHGEAWSASAVRRLKSQIEHTSAGRTPLRWSVVESLPVSDDVKLKGVGAGVAVEAWIASLEALASEDVRTISYNFQPVVDWVRTDLEWLLPSGATALRFDQNHFAVFDLHILQRAGAERSYTEPQRFAARMAFEAMSADNVRDLTMTLTRGLPGATTEPLDLDVFRDRIEIFRGISPDSLRSNLLAFLGKVLPIAESLSVKLTLHPDDPPRRLFDLPRIVSSASDYELIFDSVPSIANGMCLCTGSIGLVPDIDLPTFTDQFSNRIHFAHLRSIHSEPDGSFFETAHLEGDFDMIAVLQRLLIEERRRLPNAQIPFRPDHGHRMLDDLAKRGCNPGYTAIGRMKGLSELRGAIHALESRDQEHSATPSEPRQETSRLQ
jgi:mannonate dehydratase